MEGHPFWGFQKRKEGLVTSSVAMAGRNPKSRKDGFVGSGFCAIGSITEAVEKVASSWARGRGEFFSSFVSPQGEAKEGGNKRRLL